MSNFTDYNYVISGYRGFTFNEAIKLWKTKYQEDIRDFYKEVCTHPSMDFIKDFVTEQWDNILPATPEEAFAQTNAEHRRAYFDAIGVAKLMSIVKPELLDRQVINKKRAAWDDDNKHITKEFEDVYELYRVTADQLYKDIKERWFSGREDMYVVRCWCTTTNREYWLFTRHLWNAHKYNKETGRYEQDKPNAIEAIAWTIRIDITNPERIYRQGDIIVAKHSDTSEQVEPYHLSKEQYLDLMYSET